MHLSHDLPYDAHAGADANIATAADTATDTNTDTQTLIIRDVIFYSRKFVAFDGLFYST